MQPLDDINPDILNYGTEMGALELLGAVTVCIIASYINEIIEMDDEQIDNIIKEIEREELK